MLLRSLSVLLISAVLAGCSLQAPAPLYQLDAGQPALPKATEGALVLLGPLTLADYLQRGEVLQPRPGRGQEDIRRLQPSGQLAQQ